MSLDLKHEGISVLGGLLLAGVIVPLAVVAAPTEWRGPWMAWIVGSLAVALIVFLRWPKAENRP
jgi:hypothetical protein